MSAIRLLRGLLVASLLACVPFGAGSTAHAVHAAVDWLPIGADHLPLELTTLLRANPYTFFRFVNRGWVSRVCRDLGRDMKKMPLVRLHGDAHLEQYAFTETAFGLDDFDDTTEGSAVIDLVRFIGSIRLIARDRGWSSDIDRITDAYLSGYRRGLADPGAPVSPPRIVVRLRLRPVRAQKEFLAWAEGLMTPVPSFVEDATRNGLALLADQAATGPTRLPRQYFEVKRVGALHMGVGSRDLPKLLIRVQGLTLSPDDDVILEAKEPAADLSGLTCTRPPPQSPAVRVLAGAQQVGRLKHTILSLVPRLMVGTTELRHWWIQDWSPEYTEVNTHDYESADELAEVAFDSGFQLGSSSVSAREKAPAERRRWVAAAIARLEPRVRETAQRLTDEMLEAWAAFAGRGGE
jgi:hypothetical protein